MLKYQKSGDTALDFTFKDVSGLISTKMLEGMLTMLLEIKSGNAGDESENTPILSN